MAVVEYMFIVDEKGKRQIPGFIGDRGHWYDSATETYVGWIADNRDFYVPDTIVTLSKEDLVQRQLTVHASNPMMSMGDNPEAVESLFKALSSGSPFAGAKFSYKQGSKSFNFYIEESKLWNSKFSKS